MTVKTYDELEAAFDLIGLEVQETEQKMRDLQGVCYGNYTYLTEYEPLRCHQFMLLGQQIALAWAAGKIDKL